MDRSSAQEPRAPARVLVVEPQPLLRLGLQVTLEQEPDLAVVGTVGKLDSAEHACETSWPDVALVNRSLSGDPYGDALGFVEHLRSRFPGARVILLGASVDELDVRRAMRAGAWGYLPITVTPQVLAAGVRAVHAGEVVLPRSLVRQFLDQAASRSAAS